MATKTTTKQPAPPNTVGKLVPIDLKLIDTSKTNPRKHFDDAALKDLASSISSRGVLQAILLRPAGKRYEIVCGERRYRASKLAGLKAIPANILTLDDKAVLEIQVIENLQRSDISPIEEAESYAQLVKKHGYTPDTLASKIGKSASYVQKRIQLALLDKPIRERVAQGQIPLSHALLLSRLPNADLQKEGLRTIEYSTGVFKPLAESQKLIIEKFMLKIVSAPFDTKDATLNPKMGACTTCQYRTGNQKELFDDVKGSDLCSNPTCYGDKVERWWKDAKVDGMKVSLTESKKIFNSWNSSLNYSAGYVELKERNWQMPDKATYKSLIGKDVTTFYAVNPYTNRLVELAKENDVKAALKRHPAMKKASSGYTASAQDKKRKEEWARNKAVQKAVREAFLPSYRGTAVQMDSLTKLRMLFKGMLVHLRYQVDDFLKNEGVKGVTYNNRAQKSIEYVDELTELGCWEGMFTLLTNSMVESQHEEDRSLFHSIATAFGVDVESIKQQVKAEFDLKKAAAKTKGKKKSAPKAKAVAVVADDDSEDDIESNEFDEDLDTEDDE